MVEYVFGFEGCCGGKQMSLRRFTQQMATEKAGGSKRRSRAPDHPRRKPFGVDESSLVGHNGQSRTFFGGGDIC